MLPVSVKLIHQPKIQCASKNTQTAMALKVALIPLFHISVLMVYAKKTSSSALSNTSAVKNLSKLISEIKCVDGICREKCTFVSSSCPADNPIRCADGSCAGLMSECASALCDSNEPFRCADGSCSDNIAKCKYPYNIKIVKRVSITSSNELKYYPLLDQNNIDVGLLQTSTIMNISYRGFALSESKKTKLGIVKMYDRVYLTYFAKPIEKVKARDFIRSAAVEIDFSSNPESSETKNSIKLTLKADKIISQTHFDKQDKEVN